MHRSNSLLSLSFLLVGIAIGFIGVLICLTPDLALTGLLSGKGKFVTGGLLTVVGIALLGLMYYTMRKRYMQLTLSCGSAVIDHGIIEYYVRHYFAELFPDQRVEIDIGIQSDGKIEIFTQLPLLDESEAQLARIENELGVLLSRRLRYEREVLLTLIER